MITLLAPENNIEISIENDVVKEFKRRERAGLNAEGPSAYAWMGEGDDNIVSGRILNAPVSVFLKWRNTDPTKPMNLQVSLDPDFKHDGSMCGRCATIGEPIASSEGDGVYISRVENLYSGKRYYWRVCDGTAVPEVRTFTTLEGETRMIRVDTLKNIRDIGGYMTDSGKRVKQGLFYRGPAFRNDFTMRMWHVFMEDLGIKTELDVRLETIGKEFDTMLGPLCDYRQLPTEAYGEAFEERYRESFQKIFELLGEPATYPVYLHCAAGADRTGTIVYLIGAILGMSEEDIKLEYNLTAASFDTPNFNKPTINEYLAMMEEKHPGSTLREKLIYTLYEFGITDETFEKLRNVFLEQ